MVKYYRLNYDNKWSYYEKYNFETFTAHENYDIRTVTISCTAESHIRARRVESFSTYTSTRFRWDWDEVISVLMHNCEVYKTPQHNLTSLCTMSNSKFTIKNWIRKETFAKRTERMGYFLKKCASGRLVRANPKSRK